MGLKWFLPTLMTFLEHNDPLPCIMGHIRLVAAFI